MSYRKTAPADLRSQYPIHVELSLFLALALLVVAFRAPISGQSDFDALDIPAEHITIEDIPLTDQPEDPPPPPKPQVPVAVPDDLVLEDDPIDFDTYLEIGEASNLGPPPDEQADPIEDPAPEVFVVVEEMPELLGGLASIMKHVSYPEMARKAGVEGTVVVQFIVGIDGETSGLRVLKSLGAGLDEEALDAVREARFRPGRQRGKAVPVKMSIPIVFTLR